MTKGTPSFGKHNKILHIRCRRCGRNAFHKKQRKCAACGFGVYSTIRRYSWQNKNINGKRFH